MEPVRARADTVIDTTEYALGDLKAKLDQSYGLESDPGLAIFVTSFSYKRGLPRDADLVFDVRFFSNPHYDKLLRPKTGQDADVQAYIAKDPAFEGFDNPVKRYARATFAALLVRRKKLSDDSIWMHGRTTPISIHD